MIVRALDVNGDWEFGSGRSNYKKNNDAVAQLIVTNLLSFLGDCFFALDDGIDWFNLLGSKDIPSLNLSIRTRILNTTDVKGLLELSIGLDENRKQTIRYQAATVYSTVPLTGQVGAPNA